MKTYEKLTGLFIHWAKVYKIRAVTIANITNNSVFEHQDFIAHFYRQVELLNNQEKLNQTCGKYRDNGDSCKRHLCPVYAEENIYPYVF